MQWLQLCCVNIHHWHCSHIKDYLVAPIILILDTYGCDLSSSPCINSSRLSRSGNRIHKKTLMLCYRLEQYSPIFLGWQPNVGKGKRGWFCEMGRCACVHPQLHLCEGQVYSPTTCMSGAASTSTHCSCKPTQLWIGLGPVVGHSPQPTAHNPQVGDPWATVIEYYKCMLSVSSFLHCNSRRS